MRIMSSSSYNAVTPIHCAVHLKETDISLKGPKYHNLMEERLLQSRLNHLENQLRRTTLVMQRQQAHIQKTLNNIPKPSKNLDRRVAEAFRFIMAEELYQLGVEEKKKVVPETTSQTSVVSSHHSSEHRSRDMYSECSLDEMSEPDSNRLLRMVTRRPSSTSLSTGRQMERNRSSVTLYSNRKFDIKNINPDKVDKPSDKWKVVKKFMPALRFQRRVLVMEPFSRTKSSQKNMTSGENLTKWASVKSHVNQSAQQPTTKQETVRNMWADIAKRAQEEKRRQVAAEAQANSVAARWANLAKNAASVTPAKPEKKVIEPVKEEAVKEEAVKEEAVKEEAVKEEAVKEEAVKEEAVIRPDRRSQTLTKEDKPAEIELGLKKPVPVKVAEEQVPTAWKRITYRRRPTEADTKWKSVLGALKKTGQISESLHEYSD